jgi:glycosyltransferase involved in cell wall biosynthesis
MAQSADGVSIVIPVYNEENSISETVSEINAELEGKYAYEIIVVDDGSTDRTAEIIRGLRCKSVRHPINIGYGQSIITGIGLSTYGKIMTIDADKSYSVKDMPALIEKVKDCDMVIGRRAGKQFWGSLLKHPARLIFLWFAEFTVGKEIPDVNSGLRIFKMESFRKVDFPVICRGFSFSSTMTLSFLATGMSVVFEPISYLPREGKSKVNYFRDIFRTLQTLVEIITYYNPLKLIIIICAVPAFFTVLFAALAAASGSALFFVSSVLSLLAACVIFALGLVVDSVRLRRSSDKSGNICGL